MIKPECCLCEAPHELAECGLFDALTVAARRSIIEPHRLCQVCLVRHGELICPNLRYCGINGCQEPHHPLLHEDGVLPDFGIRRTVPIKREDIKEERPPILPPRSLADQIDQIRIRVLPDDPEDDVMLGDIKREPSIKREGPGSPMVTDQDTPPRNPHDFFTGAGAPQYAPLPGLRETLSNTPVPQIPRALRPILGPYPPARGAQANTFREAPAEFIPVKKEPSRRSIPSPKPTDPRVLAVQNAQNLAKAQVMRTFERRGDGTLCCPLCNQGEHARYSYCQAFRINDISQRERITSEFSLCLRCLKRGHTTQLCPQPRDPCCGVNGCRLDHHPLLHRITFQPRLGFQKNVTDHCKAKKLHMAQINEVAQVCALCREQGHNGLQCQLLIKKSASELISLCEKLSCCIKCLFFKPKLHQCPCDEVVCGVDMCTQHHHPFLHRILTKPEQPEPIGATPPVARAMGPTAFEPNKIVPLPGRYNFIEIQNEERHRNGGVGQYVTLSKADFDRLLAETRKRTQGTSEAFRADRDILPDLDYE